MLNNSNAVESSALSVAEFVELHMQDGKLYTSSLTRNPDTVEADALRAIQSFSLLETQRAMQFLDSSLLGKDEAREGSPYSSIRQALVNRLPIVL